MAYYDTDLEASYQTDDSDINFIPGYMMENAKTLKCSDSNADEDMVWVWHMPKKPLADEEWLANHNRGERERLELEEKLTQRLSGSVELSEWYKINLL